MRTMLRVTMDTQAGNRAIQDNTMPQMIAEMLERLKPEATYFGPDGGRRTAFIVFDLKDSSQLPAITEPLFQRLNATVEFMPVMNLDDLKKGLSELTKR